MPDTKLTNLTALTGAAVEQAADSMPIVDFSVTQTKKILPSELAQALLVIGTPQATTSGTNKTFANIPSWVKKITLLLSGVSTNGVSSLVAYFNPLAGVTVSAAGTRSAETSSVLNFQLTQSCVAARSYSGVVVFTLENSGPKAWSSRGVISADSGAAGIHFSAGRVSASNSGGFDLVFTSNASDTFDAGEVNILYE